MLDTYGISLLKTHKLIGNNLLQHILFYVHKYKLCFIDLRNMRQKNVSDQKWGGVAVN